MIRALIVAAGTGSRVGNIHPKQYLKIANKEIIHYSVELFVNHSLIDEVYLVVSPNDQQILQLKFSPKVKILTVGGSTRALSVKNALQKMPNANINDWIMIHDSARCLLTENLISRMITQLTTDPVGGVPVINLHDSVMNLNPKTTKNYNLKREWIGLVQTPQMFRSGVLNTAFTHKKFFEFKDEGSLVEKSGFKVQLLAGDPENIKITYPIDLIIAEQILKIRTKICN